MGFAHGKNMGLLVGSVDASGLISQASFPVQREMADQTPVKGAPGPVWRDHLPGPLSAACDFAGFLDPARDLDLTTLLTAEATAPVTWAPQGLYNGAPAKSIDGFLKSYVGDSAFDKVVTFAGRAEAKGRFWQRGVIAASYRNFNSPGGFSTYPATTLDNGAASTNGLTAIIHVTALSGTLPWLAVAVADAALPDYSDATTIISAPLYTVKGSNVITLPGTIRRYLGIFLQTGGTGTLADVHVALHRL